VALTAHFLDAVGVLAEQSDRPLTMPWPMPGNPGAFVSFATFAEWRAFMLRFNLRSSVLEIITTKFDRAHKLHVLAWVDFDLIKVGELTALITLELAVTDRYRAETQKRSSLPLAPSRRCRRSNRQRCGARHGLYRRRITPAATALSATPTSVSTQIAAVVDPGSAAHAVTKASSYSILGPETPQSGRRVRRAPACFDP
jgi:hypothetical protein